MIILQHDCIDMMPHAAQTNPPNQVQCIGTRPFLQMSVAHNRTVLPADFCWSGLELINTIFRDRILEARNLQCVSALFGRPKNCR